MLDPHLPLIDLHRHLDGSVRLGTILELGLQHNLPLPAKDLESLRPYVQVTSPQPGVMAFISKFEWMTRVLVDEAACYRVAFESVEDAAREGLDYVELRFSPWFMAEPHHLHPRGVVEAVCSGVEDASRATGLPVNLIGILSRTYGPETAWKELDALLAHRQRLVGLDLAGDETNFPGEMFVEHFRRGRDAGWAMTVHAGEISGPESVWQAINQLGANRIGHCLAAVREPALMDTLVARGIGIEANLTSNVQTSVVSGYAAHPVRQFLDYGLPTCINTDDPGISGIDLRYEYEVAAVQAGLTVEQIRRAQQFALEMAFLSPAARQEILERKMDRANGDDLYGPPRAAGLES